MRQQELIKIYFYNIRRCGFHRFGSNAPDFSSLSDILSQLQDWTAGVDLSLTKIADPKGNNEEYPVYLLGIERLGEEWAFATWNEVPSHQMGVASVSSDSKVGTPRVHINGIEPNSIPGYATYFWALPKYGLIASIRFNHMSSGQERMRSYIERFMSTYTRYVIQGVDAEGNTVILGYTDANDNVPKKAKPYFRTTPFVKPAHIAFIMNNRTSIRKVIRQGSVTVQNAIHRTWWQDSIRLLTGNPNASNNAFMKQSVRLELEYQPSIDELELIIGTQANELETAGWEDIGFVMRGSPTIHWLGRNNASGSFDLTIDRKDAEAVDLQSLLRVLNGNRANIFKLLE
jgi:hypothetical protein